MSYHGAVQIVLDTNVLYAGLRSQLGASYVVLRLVLEGALKPVLSVPLVLEYEMALKRSATTLGLTHQDIDEVVDYLCAVGHHQEIHYLWRPILRDPRDELLLEVAVAAKCQKIVTHNVKDFAGAERFGVEVLTPKTLLLQRGDAP